MAVYQVNDVGQENEQNVAVALKTDKLTNANGHEAILDNNTNNVILPNGIQYKFDGNGSIVGGVGTGPSGYTLYSEPDKLMSVLVQNSSAPNRVWTFHNNGSVGFPDGTVQSTAYDYAPMNLANMDGGFASTRFDHSYVYVDCGGSARRGVLTEDLFDGESASNGYFDKVLNGGGA